MTKIVSIQPRALDDGKGGPHPYRIDSEALVLDQDRWMGEPSLLEGFVHDPLTTGRVDLSFESFWTDPAEALGMYPIFTHDTGSDSIFTHGDKCIIHVSVTEDGVTTLKADLPPRFDTSSLSQEVKAREYDHLMEQEASGLMVRIPRRDYGTLLDIALTLTLLKAGEKVDIDGRMHLLLDAGKVQRLNDDVAFLGCLEAAGVDNWDGYSIATAAFDETHPREDED